MSPFVGTRRFSSRHFPRDLFYLSVLPYWDLEPTHVLEPDAGNDPAYEYLSEISDVSRDLHVPFPYQQNPSFPR
jgi:hypothetical protein